MRSLSAINTKKAEDIRPRLSNINPTERLLEKLQRDLRRRIRLSQHRRTRLNQNVVPSEAGRFSSDVHIENSAVGSFQVRAVGRQGV